MSRFGTWTLIEESGDAAALHGRVVDPTLGRQIWHLTVTDPALVLGSTQVDIVDHGVADAEGISVVRRRSGGGAVLLVPGESTWIDLVLPRDDELWDDDVTRSFAWLGDVWVETLGRVGLERGDLTVHAGGLERGDFGAVVCFAGVGPGEVTTGSGKVVGLSQRRTRDFARFQCTLHHAWHPERYLRLLAAGLGPDTVLPSVATVNVDSATLLATLSDVLATR